MLFSHPYNKTNLFAELKQKRPTCDTWNTREKLCLASSVLKSGDQNWMSTSRCMKSLTEKDCQRPPDWYSQKSCAVQYALLLENADTPRRKKKESTETTGESIVRRLTQERITELGQFLNAQREEYLQLKNELKLLETGNISDEELQKMYLEIELEEREQDQKGRGHTALLGKRQKQDMQTPQSHNFAIQRKSESSDGHDTLDPLLTDEEEKKNKGGRSPLLTSLLKSPSPTTQIQTQTSSAQVMSPTIASLLGTSPKIPTPQLTQTVSPQLHQRVSTAIANAAPERPSAGAPTLSMLLELPANLQRTTFPNLQLQASTANLPQQNINVQMMQVENQRGNVQIIEPPGNLSASEIIDHIDEVIPKDIMADVIDKDEINEIIGDIEEIIKSEIIDNPQVLDSRTAGVMETLIHQPPLVPGRQETRNVPANVSLSDYPESEIAIEEIDSSSSNIAEIIGTVAVEKTTTQETKEVECQSSEKVMTEKSSRSSVELKNEKAEADKSLGSIDNLIVGIQTTVEKRKEKTTEETKKSVKEEIKNSPSDDVKRSPREDVKKSPMEDVKMSLREDVKKSSKEEGKKSPKEDPKLSDKEDPRKFVKEEAKKSANEDSRKLVKVDPKKSVKEETEKSHKDATKKEIKETPKKEIKDNLKNVKESLKKETRENSKENVVQVLEDSPLKGSKLTFEKKNSSEEKESLEPEKADDNKDVDQLEMNLAKITGDQEAASTEVLSVSSDDHPSTEDTEKSQDISLILEDEEISPCLQEKKKETEEISVIESPADGTDSSASSKEDVIMIKENSGEDEKEETLKQVEEESKKVVALEKDTKNIKKDVRRDFSDKILKTEDIEEDSKDLEEEEREKVEKSDLPKETEELPTANLIKSEEIKLELPKKEHEFQEETSTDEGLKNEKEIKEAKEEKNNKKNIDLDISVKKEQDGCSESVGELDEEESTLNKLSGGRVMKTYSKKQTIAVDSEPEIEGSIESADYRAWKKAVMLVYNRLATHKYASAFLRPITEDQAPGYHSIIFRPMDLSTIKKNIDNGTIRSTRHFQRDVMLMFQNAIMYNKHDTFVYKMATTMQQECLQQMQVSAKLNFNF